MATTDPAPHELLLDLAASWHRLERSLDAGLSSIRGISFPEYRMLMALRAFPRGAASRADLAEAIGRTPSGVTRALKPLEKIGVVRTVSSERDARLALATLTKAGEELLADATDYVNAQVESRLAGVAGRSPVPADLLEP